MIAHESLRRLDFAVEHLRWLEPGATRAACSLVPVVGLVGLRNLWYTQNSVYT